MQMAWHACGRARFWGCGPASPAVKDETLAELDEVPKLKLQLASLQQELEAEKAEAGLGAKPPSLELTASDPGDCRSGILRVFNIVEGSSCVQEAADEELDC